MRQTQADLEVIVVDNASTDGSWAIAQEFARSDPRVRISRNPRNLGPVRNWQRCAAEARGELSKLLFSDDAIAPDFLERTVPFLDDPGVGLVTTAANVSGEVQYRWRHGRTSSSRYLWNLMFNGRLPVSPCAALLRTADLRRNLTDFGRHGIGPDLLLLLRTARQYPAVVHLCEPLVFFRDHADSISRIRRKELAQGYRAARARFVFSLAKTMQT